VDATQVRERLQFARRRCEELLALNHGNLAGASASERQQLIQEFLFHVVGAIEVLAQVVNEVRELGIDAEAVSITRVAKAVEGEPLELQLRSLYANARHQPLHPDPYGEDGLVFRMYNYRGQVTHRGSNPFLFTLPSRTAHLLLDPRNPEAGASNVPVAEELRRMYEIVARRCEDVLAIC
jgi:hypothetical protein